VSADKHTAPVPVRMWVGGFGDTPVLLACPRCRHEPGFLHHRKVETYFRREDAPEVLVAVADRGRVGLERRVNNTSGNPSRRRDGVRVHFWCEHCGDELVLNVAQHKGCTEVFWSMSEVGDPVWDDVS
jgi:hypothetical protein